jgi:putative PEP-CTERM system TPR-repeat lipoprotein
MPKARGNEALLVALERAERPSRTSRIGRFGRAIALGLALGFGCIPSGASGSAEKASRFYNDALARFERADNAGAIIQLKNALQQDPKLLAAHVLLGRAYLVAGDPAAAEDSLERALQLGVDRSEVALPLARALAAQGKHRAFLDRFPAEAVPAQSRPELLVLRGQSFRALGDLAAARQAYLEARAAHPRYLPALLSLADLAAVEGRRPEAVALVDEAMAIAPGEAGTWHFRGVLALGAGDVKLAQDAFAKALAIDARHLEARLARVTLAIDLGRLDDAAGDVRQLAAQHADEPRALYVRAVYLAKRGDEKATRELLVTLTNAIDQVPRDVLKQRAQELLLLAALSHDGLAQREKARQYLEDYVALRPRDVGARRLLASILLAQREYRAAISVLEGARKDAPGDPQVLALLGSAHMGRGQHHLASGYLEQALRASGGAAGIQATYGLSLLGTGQGELAIQQLQEAFRKDRRNVQSGVVLAVLYMRRNQPKLAVEAAEAVAKLGPANPNALNLLGVARLAAGDRKGARSAYQEAIAADATFVPARLNLGRLDVADGDFVAARARFEGVLKLRQSNAQAMYELGLAEVAAGRTADAIRWLEKARSADRRHIAAGTALVDLHLGAKATDKALTVAKEIDAAAPDSLEALGALGRVYLALGNGKQAQTVFGRMARLAAFDPAWQTEIARYQFAANNREGAAYSLDKAFSGQPDYLPAHILMAEIELRSGNLAKAEQRAKVIIGKAPNRAIGYQLLGDASLARKSYTEALERYRTALAKEETTDGALRIFRTHLQSGNAKGAIQYLETWVRTHPMDRLARHMLTEGYLRAGDLAAARAGYEQILREQGDDAAVLNNLANILLLQGNPQALAYAERAYLLAPGDASIQDTLGWTLVQQGQLDQGLRHLRDARLRAPQNPEIRYHLAAALARAGRLDEARQELHPILVMVSSAEARKLAQDLGLRDAAGK